MIILACVEKNRFEADDSVEEMIAKNT